MPTLRWLEIAGEAGPWAEAGFGVEPGGFRVGGVAVRMRPGAGRGIVGWGLSGLRAREIDGLPTADDGSPPEPAPPHPNGALSIDHVVVTTADLERTLAALADAGFDLRRRREAETPSGIVHQAFYRVGETVLEVVAAPGAPAGPTAFWGLVFTVADLDACARLLGGRLGSARDAVQPGRRIATVRREAGLGLPVALMTPEPPRG